MRTRQAIFTATVATAVMVLAFALGTTPAVEGNGTKVANAVGGGYIPYSAKQPVAFSHRSHAAAGYTCANCHPKAFPYKRNTFKMADLYAGKACGTCHNGKTKAPKNPKAVASAVSDCGSCHAPENAITYEKKGPGTVRFDHGTHTAKGQEVEAGYACGDCHPTRFARKAGQLKMPLPHRTGCATCHNGKTTSPSGETAFNIMGCPRCHKSP